MNPRNSEAFFPARRFRAFTLLELMVVIVILGILASLLLPAMSKVKQRARRVQCASNLKQMGVAFMLYAGDHQDQLPPLNSGGPFMHPSVPHDPTNWWYQILSSKEYLPPVQEKGKVWRCPNVLAEDLYAPFGELMEGYGPVENTGHVPGLNSIIWWAYDTNGAPRGSERLGSIGRTSQIWLVGDVGVPKSPNRQLDQLPYGGYYRTDMATFPPDALGLWDGKPPKQPALRHGRKASICFVDGHVESWELRDLAANKNDIFSLKSR